MPILTLSQAMQVSVSGGFASYLGDLQTKQFVFNTKDPSVGVHMRLELNKHFAVRAGFTSARVSAYDKNNTPLLQARNLSFITNINEVHLLMEYSVFDLKKYKLSPHIFIGAAGYRFNPYAYDNSGNKVYLQPLKTEGQGLPQYQDRKPYSLNQFAIPIGGGLRYALNEDMVLGLEIGYRRLFTDYFDDVSSDYVDKAILERLVGPKSVEMAFRGSEINSLVTVDYPAEGTPRGKSTYNDWYAFSQFTFTMPLSRLFDLNDRKGRISCPRKF